MAHPHNHATNVVALLSQVARLSSLHVEISLSWVLHTLLLIYESWDIKGFRKPSLEEIAQLMQLLSFCLILICLPEARIILFLLL